MNKVFFSKDKINHGHVCKPHVQMRCLSKHHFDFYIELAWKSIPQYIEYRKEQRVIPFVAEYEYVHDSQHICQSMTYHVSIMFQRG